MSRKLPTSQQQLLGEAQIACRKRHLQESTRSLPLGAGRGIKAVRLDSTGAYPSDVDAHRDEAKKSTSTSPGKLSQDIFQSDSDSDFIGFDPLQTTGEAESADPRGEADEPTLQEMKELQQKVRDDGAASLGLKAETLLATATEDLGRWKGTDDILLLNNVEQLGNLWMVHKAVSFSCRFSLLSVKSRWWALLFSPAISWAAKVAMSEVPSELRRFYETKTHFSDREEDVLRLVASSGADSSLEAFSTLLSDHREQFHRSRTPRRLQEHWRLMRRFSLLCGQEEQLKNNDFSDDDDDDDDDDNQESVELFDGDDELVVVRTPRDTTLSVFVEEELEVKRQCDRATLTRLERQCGQLACLLEHVGHSQTRSWEAGAVAVLEGAGGARFVMRTDEVTFGRRTSGCHVDFDLAPFLESTKMVSRRQGRIVWSPVKDLGRHRRRRRHRHRGRRVGSFRIVNEGRRSFFVDGRRLLRGGEVEIDDYSVIVVSRLELVFHVAEQRGARR